jgi:hypothetical protein
MNTLGKTLVVIGLAALATGMVMGIAMGAARDFSLRHVHAHLNLLGGVANIAMGLICLHLARPDRLKAFAIAAAIYNVGVAVFLPGVSPQALAITDAGAILGSITALVGFGLFTVLAAASGFAAGRASSVLPQAEGARMMPRA